MAVVCCTCIHVNVEGASIDLSCQAHARCDIHPEYGRFILYGNRCPDGIEAT
jgi:hypothetical protein